MSTQRQPYRLGAWWAGPMYGPNLGTPPIVPKPVATANTLAVFRGDFVQALTTGDVYPSTIGGGNYPYLSYVVLGVKQYLASDGQMKRGSFLPASTAYTGGTSLTNPLASILLCIPVAGQLFQLTVPTAEASAAAAQAKVGKCIDINPAAGSTVNGLSGHLAYTGTDATYGWQSTTGSGQLRLERIPQYGIAGTLNDPTVANWTGIFSVIETIATV
jgi:hypothetical protein